MRTRSTVLAWLLLLSNSLWLNTPAARAQQAPPAWVSAQRGSTTSTSGVGRKQDAAGNLYEVGMFSTATSVGSTTLTCQGRFDGFLAKYTPAGTLAWVRQFSSPGEDCAADVALDAAGNAYVVGYFTGSISLGGGQTLTTGGRPGRQAFIVKYDPSGTPLWAQRNTIYGAVTTSPDCPPEGFASAVQVTANGQVIVTGYYSLTTDFGFGSLALGISSSTGPAPLITYLARFSAATGTPLSIVPASYADRTTGVAVIYPQQLLEAADGGTYLVSNYFMATSFPGGANVAAPTSADIMAVKYNAAGQVQWVRTLGGPDFDNLTKAATDLAGNLYLTGTFRQSLAFGSTMLTGTSSSRPQEEAFVAKFSSQGQAEWAQALTSPGDDFLYDLCFDAAGNVYATGGCHAPALVAGRTLAAVGGRDVVVLAFTPQGQLSWVQQAGSPTNDWGFSIAFTPQGRLRVYGTSFDRISFGALGSVYGDFVAELATSAPLATATTRAQPTAPYPNPAIGLVVVPGAAPGTRLDLLDALGRLAQTTTVAADTTIPVQNLSPGVYTLRATTTQGQPLTGRVVVGN